ncbi:MAG: GntR family transcriptional regulator [Desulfatibacillaceae bacterium]|nr:GntR family transcriptional regulator [Desulfatibacillaceae bacterium]
MRSEDVVNILAQRIFTGKLRPGDKLPTERELAQEMGLDRTSLRVALRQLASMRVLDIRPGDGIYVLDYSRHAGLDFLRLIFSQTVDEKGQPFCVDEYTIQEAWEFWAAFFPVMLQVAGKRSSPRDIKMQMDCIDEELKSVDDPQKVVELNLAQQDMVARATNNIVFQLFSNASRPIRRVMVGNFVSLLDRESLIGHILIKKALLEESVANPLVWGEIAARYGEALSTYLNLLRRQSNGHDSFASLMKQYLDSTKHKN